MLRMTDEERKAYEWARGQNFPSVAATYSRTLAAYIDRCKADERMLSDPDDFTPPLPAAKNKHREAK